MSDSTPQLPQYLDAEYYPAEVMVAAPPRPRQRYWLHILLLLATIFTTMMVGTRLEMNYLQGRAIFTTGDDFIPLFPIGFILQHPSRILMGLPFSLTLMGILLAHEMGHYIFCLRYGVYATLPYFIPAPTLIGTMGAFIRIKSPIRTRSALFDIGIAGPIAGFVVAFPVMLFALTLSKPAPAVVDGDTITTNFPLIFQFVHTYIIGGTTIPLEQMLLHPTAIAAWVGMFATALNLLPGGQLDGGHIVYALFPKAHRYISRITVGALLPMGIWWPGWLVWALLLTISGMRHPNVDPWPELDPKRRLLAIVALVMLVVTITPIPFPSAALWTPHW